MATTPILAAREQSYSLWFVNQSGAAGTVCVYQDARNVTPNLDVAVTLAWMVTGANPRVTVQFVWSLDYAFAWFDERIPYRQQILPGDPDGANTTTLSYGRFGFDFATPQSGGQAGALSIQQDGSVPRVAALAGIGMHGAGTFACPAGPNQKLVFGVAATLSYRITFGPYTFAVNDPLSLGSLNRAGAVTFASNVFSMTATLDEANAWTIASGAPPAPSQGGQRVGVPAATVVYEAGKGVVSAP